MLAGDRLDARETGPRLVIDRPEILGVLIDPLLVHMLETIARLLFQPPHPLVDVLGEKPLFELAQVSMLVEIVPKPVILEQPDVILEIVRVRIERRELEPLDQQPPPLITVAEVDGTVHRLQTALLQPVARGVEQHVGHPLVVDRFEKAAAAGRLIFRSGHQLPIVKSGYPAHDPATLVDDDPPDRLAVAQQLVRLGMKAVLDILIERTDPVRLIAVETLGQVQKLVRSAPRGHFLQRICSHKVSR